MVRWWDIRNFSKSFRELLVVTDESEMIGDGVSCLTYEQTIPSNFMLGTDQGRVVTARLQSKSGSNSLLMNSWKVKEGVVCQLQSKLKVKVRLASGSWLRDWEGLVGTIFMFPFSTFRDQTLVTIFAAVVSSFPRFSKFSSIPAPNICEGWSP